MKTVDKTKEQLEELKNNAMTFSRLLVEGSPYAQHTPQTILPGKVNEEDPEKSKKAQLCWDGTTNIHLWETTMNKVAPIDEE